MTKKKIRLLVAQQIRRATGVELPNAVKAAKGARRFLAAKRAGEYPPHWEWNIPELEIRSGEEDGRGVYHPGQMIVIGPKGSITVAQEQGAPFAGSWIVLIPELEQLLK